MSNDSFISKIHTNKYKYYAELLNDKVFSQHTQKRYSIKKSKDQTDFEIVDSQATIFRNQKITDKQKFEDIPF